MKTVIIVQARMTSTRLPGKVLKTVGGKPLLEYLIERLRRVRLADAIVIATTTNDSDLPIVALCQRLQVPVTRGAEDDVLARYHDAAIQHAADVIVRVTSDCPLIDPQVVDALIAFFQKHRDQYDYVATRLMPSYPLGMDAELLTFHALDEAAHEALEPADREHVTPFIYRHPQRYRLANRSCEQNLAQHRWTVDTPEDFDLVGRIIGALYPVKPDFSLADIRDLLLANPTWVDINAHVRQKTLAD